MNSKGLAPGTDIERLLCAAQGQCSSAGLIVPLDCHTKIWNQARWRFLPLLDVVLVTRLFRILTDSPKDLSLVQELDRSPEGC